MRQVQWGLSSINVCMYVAKEGRIPPIGSKGDAALTPAIEHFPSSPALRRRASFSHRRSCNGSYDEVNGDTQTAEHDVMQAEIR